MAEYNHEKYYWLRLKRDFFKRHDIQVIESMPNGKDYVLFYLKLMVESIDHDGYLRFSETIPYNEEMLSAITNTNVDVVRSATKLLHQLGMIEIMSDQTIYLTEVNALIGSQSVSAERKQIQRQNRKELLQGGQKVDKCPPEIELDKDSLLSILKNKISTAGAYTGVHDALIDEVLVALVKATKVDEMRFNGETYTGDAFLRVAEHLTVDQVAKVVNRIIGRSDIENREKYIQSIIASTYAIAE